VNQNNQSQTTSRAVDKLVSTNRRKFDQLSASKWCPHLRLGTCSPPSRGRITFRQKGDVLSAAPPTSLQTFNFIVVESSPTPANTKCRHVRFQAPAYSSSIRRTTTNDRCLGQSFCAYLRGRPPPTPAVYLLACAPARHAASWGPPAWSTDDGRRVGT